MPLYDAREGAHSKRLGAVLQSFYFATGLTLPAAAAGQLTRRLDQMMVVAVGIGAGVSLMGLASSYGPGWPPGATIVEFAIVAYLIAAAVKKLVKKICSCT